MGCGTINDPDKKRGLLAHAATATEERRKFMELRRPPAEPPSDGAQLKYFLLYSSVGVTGVFAFGLLLFFSGISGT
jgi:hypothetical protein